MATKHEPFSVEAMEEVHTIATLVVASVNRRTLTDGTVGNRIMVNLDLMRALAEAVEQASPGGADRVRASLAAKTVGLT